MKYETQQDVTGLTWLIATYDYDDKRTREKWRFPIRRIHEIRHLSDGGLEVELVSPRSGGNYVCLSTRTITSDDVDNFMLALFPEQQNNGPYR